MTVVTLKDIVNRFEATQVAYVEKRDGETGLTSMDPRVVGRVIALMGIVISDGSKSMARFQKMIEDFEKKNAEL
jgi:hypothetical protein